MVGKQNNKRFISHETFLKYDFLMLFVSCSPAFPPFFFVVVRSPRCLLESHKGQGGRNEMQIVAIHKIDLWI